MRKYVVFDFDGTVADSFGSILKIIDDMGLADGKDVEFGDIRDIGTMGLIRKSGIPLWRVPGLVRKVLREMRNVDDLKLFRGMVGVFKRLDKNYSLGIVSSNSEENIRKFLKENKIEDLFGFVYSGSSLFGKHRILDKMCRKHGIDKGDVVYVGDEDRDVVAARKVGIGVIGVTWGFNSEKRLKEAKPDYLARVPKDIVRMILGDFGK